MIPHLPSFSLTSLAQAPAPAGGGGGSMLIMLVLMFVMMYFIAIRPQRKRQQELARQVEALKPGDDVITTGGVHAQIGTIKEKTVVLRVAEGVKIEFEKSAIAVVVSPRTAEAAKAAAAKELPAKKEGGSDSSEQA